MSSWSTFGIPRRDRRRGRSARSRRPRQRLSSRAFAPANRWRYGSGVTGAPRSARSRKDCSGTMPSRRSPNLEFSSPTPDPVLDPGRVRAGSEAGAAAEAEPPDGEERSVDRGHGARRRRIPAHRGPGDSCHSTGSGFRCSTAACSPNRPYASTGPDRAGAGRTRRRSGPSPVTRRQTAHPVPGSPGAAASPGTVASSTTWRTGQTPD